MDLQVDIPLCIRHCSGRFVPVQAMVDGDTSIIECPVGLIFDMLVSANFQRKLLQLGPQMHCFSLMRFFSQSLPTILFKSGPLVKHSVSLRFGLFSVISSSFFLPFVVTV